MKIIEKIVAKEKDIYNAKPVTIAFLGDSTVHGCFEVYFKLDGNIETIFDSKNAYSTKLKDMLNYLCPSAQINIINSGISGDCAENGLKRFERDIKPFLPDLVIVSYGLNDCLQKDNGKEVYKNSLDAIFKNVIGLGAECVFLTPNLFNDRVSPFILDDRLKEIAKQFIDNQLDDYVKIAKKVAKDNGVTICDAYSKWVKMQNYGINVTELLANKLNHPTREMTSMTAYMLLDTMLSN